MSFHTAEPIHSLKYCIFQHFWTPNAMTAASMSTDTLTEIAGQSVVQLARQFGTPVYVYDAAKIAERIADLAAFDVVRYAQKACSNIAILDLVRRNGALGRLRQRGRDSSGHCRRFQTGAEAASAGDRLHGRYLRSRGAEARSDPRYPRQLRLARYDRPVWRSAGACERTVHRQELRCGSTRASDTGTVKRSTRAAHNRSTESGTSSSKNASNGLRSTTFRSLALHMHIGSGTDLAHLSQVCGAMEKAAKIGRLFDPLDQCRRWAVGTLPRRRGVRRSWRLLQALGCRAPSAGKPIRPRDFARNRTRPLPGC